MDSFNINNSCAIFAIGNELLDGSTIDTNSSYISKKLVKNGFKVNQISILPDNLDIIVNTLKNSLNKHKIIITTGGLGPTFDDLTTKGISLVSEKKLILYNELLKDLEEKFRRRKKTLDQEQIKQAELPESSTIFRNSIGTAPGFAVKVNKSLIVALPGIPSEMKQIFNDYVLPYLTRQYQPNKTYTKDLYFSNITESAVNKVLLEEHITQKVNTTLNVSKGKIIVRLKSASDKLLNEALEVLQDKLRAYYFGADDETLEEVVVESLEKKNLTLSTAESCTGGLVGKYITNVPGSSNIYNGGVIVYSNEAKIKLLNIDKKLLEEKGAVSYEVARDMALNASSIFNTDVSVSITGIAGPGGGSPEKPVGLVYIGLYYKGKYKIFRYYLSGNRDNIRERSASIAMSLILRASRDEGIFGD
ncbi:MAG: competence/damage-inducible protein A [Deferribacterota bacterium]|nr:competence/damage-inducible protein A [Deferribacterota bacterium]